MTVKNEGEGSAQYFRIELVELFELIGRIGHIYYEGLPEEDEPLHIRIEHVLDALFTITGSIRKDVKIDNESQSESDDDY